MNQNTQATLPLSNTMAAQRLSASGPIRLRDASPGVERESNASVTAQASQNSPDITRTLSLGEHARFATPVPVAVANTLDADAAVIQIWEGTVLSVDPEAKSFVADLRAKIGTVPEHRGELSLQYVAPQDEDLVREGAVFYLTLYNRRKKGGTIENSQELRFRRLPSWSHSQLVKVEEISSRLRAKMRPSRVAE